LAHGLEDFESPLDHDLGVFPPSQALHEGVGLRLHLPALLFQGPELHPEALKPAAVSTAFNEEPADQSSAVIDKGVSGTGASEDDGEKSEVFHGG
jgi:hypothetical protein